MDERPGDRDRHLARHDRQPSTASGSRDSFWRWPGAARSRPFSSCLSLELVQEVSHTHRTFQDMAFFSLPLENWIQPAMPWFFQGLHGGGDSQYFLGRDTRGYEAMFYVGTVPLILAFAGALDAGPGRGGSTGFWKLMVPVSFALATMPRWWPGGYAALLQFPGLGYFRAPARYTLLTSLGLALLAGQAINRASSPRRFRAGSHWQHFSHWRARIRVLAVEAQRFCVDARSRGDPIRRSNSLADLDSRPGVRVVVGQVRSERGFWHWSRRPSSEPFTFRPHDLEASDPGSRSQPDPRHAGRDPRVGRMGGVIDNLPVSVGLTTGSPYLGMTLSPLNQFLRSLQERTSRHDAEADLWHRRLGVTHTIWDEAVAFGANEAVEALDDPAVDALASCPAGKPAKRLWRVVRHPEAYPQARVAREAHVVSDWPALRAFSVDTTTVMRHGIFPKTLPQAQHLPAPRELRSSAGTAARQSCGTTGPVT